MKPRDADRVDEAEAAPTNVVLRDLDRLTGVSCVACVRRLCGHEALFSVAMGLKNAPRCLSCLAEGLQQSGAELRDQLVSYIQHRDCYRQAWDVASERESLAQTSDHGCPWSGLTRPSVALSTAPTAPGPEEQAEEQHAVVAWDAGNMSCGDLVLELRGRLSTLPRGAVLEVTACDPGAPEDLPAWCRLTGHRLLRSVHPRYLIQRKEP